MLPLGFRKIGRQISLYHTIEKFTFSEEILDPQRVVNRVMYGTDYDPKDVGFGVNRVMKKYAEAIHQQNQEAVQRAMDAAFYSGMGFLKHSWKDDGSLEIKASPRANE
jgi:hypothetical protein